MMKVLCSFISIVQRQTRNHILVTFSVMPGTNKVTQAKYHPIKVGVDEVAEKSAGD